MNLDRVKQMSSSGLQKVLVYTRKGFQFLGEKIKQGLKFVWEKFKDAKPEVATRQQQKWYLFLQNEMAYEVDPDMTGEGLKRTELTGRIQRYYLFEFLFGLICGTGTSFVMAIERKRGWDYAVSNLGYEEFAVDLVNMGTILAACIVGVVVMFCVAIIMQNVFLRKVDNYKDYRHSGMILSAGTYLICFIIVAIAW